MSSITTLPYDSPDAAITEAFNRDGVLIISGFLSSSAISTVLQELKLEGDVESQTPVTALASKSPTTVEQVILSPQINRFLTESMSKTTRIWHGEERLSNTSRPYLSATVVFESPAGKRSEPLHRHDDIYFVDHPMERPVEVWALVALDNGSDGIMGSCVDAILGSHTWGEEWRVTWPSCSSSILLVGLVNILKRQQPTNRCSMKFRVPNGHVLTPSVLKKGDCLLLHGSTVHRGGKNSSLTLRRSLGISWTQGHMRQEENQFLNISKEVAMKLDEKTQRTIGYKMNAPFGGWYELRDPLTYLQPEDKVDKTMKEFLDRNDEDKSVFQAEV